MRISDWSSDVCSSDLMHYTDFGHSLIYVAKAGPLIDRLGPSVALPLLLALTRSLCKASREDLIPEFRGYAKALAAWGSDAAAPEARAYRGLNVDRALALTAVHGGADSLALYDALLAANADNRSEEHTSELQSLMRISYAVFCLKKK